MEKNCNCNTVITQTVFLKGAGIAQGVSHGLAADRLRHGGSGERQSPPRRPDAERFFTGNELVMAQGTVLWFAEEV